MKLVANSLFSSSKTVFIQWWTKDPSKEIAVTAYYAIFCLPGLLVAIVSKMGYFFRKEAVNGQIALQITSTLGAETANQIQDVILKS